MGRSADAPLPALRSPTRRVPLVELSTRSGGAKRAFDVVVAGVGLLCSWPLWVLVSSAIKLEDRGPVFYRQARIGQGGKVFHVWKFRSMVDRKSTRLNSNHGYISYAVFCLKKKKKEYIH